MFKCLEENSLDTELGLMSGSKNVTGASENEKHKKEKE